MLSLLHIENIALIQSADIRFEPGFNVLTGETGAGKSIIIDSIGAVLGERTSRELIRTGAKSALVTAVFTQVPPLPWLEENGFPTGEEELLLQRELQGDGRNVCRIGGRLVTVAQLRELGRQLLNIHGQHDGQQLLEPASHLGYLDQFGACRPLLESYREAYRKWHDIRREMDKLQMDEAERSRRVDTLNYQIQELERAQLRPGEDEELEARRTLLRSAGKLMEAVQGPVVLSDCLNVDGNDTPCPNCDQCRFRPVWCSAEKLLRDLFSTVTLHQLVVEGLTPVYRGSFALVGRGDAATATNADDAAAAAGAGDAQHD